MLGHAIQRNTDASSQWHVAFLAISEFHMALFMFISGNVAFRSKLDSGWLSRRCLQLVPTYIAWSFILYYSAVLPFSGSMHPTAGGPIRSLLWETITLNSAGLWFLPALLAVCLLFYLSRGRLLPAVVAIALFHVAGGVISQFQLPHHLQDLSLGLKKIAWYMPFFVAGYFVARHESELRCLGFLKWVALIAFPVFFVLPVCLPWGDHNYVVSREAWPFYPNSGYAVLRSAYGFGMALLGIGMTFAVVGLLVRVALIRRILAYLGTVTLGIYVIHLLWLKVGSGLAPSESAQSL